MTTPEATGLQEDLQDPAPQLFVGRLELSMPQEEKCKVSSVRK